MLISLSLRSVCHLHFCHACLNLLMDELAMLSARFLLKILCASLPCILVMCVVTCASLQSGALANSVFSDLVISPSPGVVYLMMPYVLVVS